MITYPLNNIDYTAEDAELFHCTRTSGIWATNDFPISVTGSDNNISIGTGIAWIRNEPFSGKVVALKETVIRNLDVADGVYPRIDVVAIQFNANNNATDIVVKKGVPASNPVRPAISRTGSIYELYLCSVYRGVGATSITWDDVTDLRLDSSVCGLMADSVTKVDTDAINNQVKNLIMKLNNELNAVKDNANLMLITDWTQDGVIPINKGGTGARTAEYARNNLNILLNDYDCFYPIEDYPHDLQIAIQRDSSCRLTIGAQNIFFIDARITFTSHPRSAGYYYPLVGINLGFEITSPRPLNVGQKIDGRMWNGFISTEKDAITGANIVYVACSTDIGAGSSQVISLSGLLHKG